MIDYGAHSIISYFLSKEGKAKISSRKIKLACDLADKLCQRQALIRSKKQLDV